MRVRIRNAPAMRLVSINIGINITAPSQLKKPFLCHHCTLTFSSCATSSHPTIDAVKNVATVNSCECVECGEGVLWIRDIFVRIRIRGSGPLIYGFSSFRQ